MTISIIGSGDFADVFDLGDGSVVKAFRRLQHSGGDVSSWEDEDALTRELFEAEVRAYERLRDFADLAVFTPKYFGRRDPCGLINSTESQDHCYVTGCGIQLEKISGAAKKFADLDEARKELAYPVLERLEKEIKPGNVWDSSCFIPGARATVTVIDFSAWDEIEACAEILGHQGYFTDQQRKQLQRHHRIDSD